MARKRLPIPNRLVRLEDSMGKAYCNSSSRCSSKGVPCPGGAGRFESPRLEGGKCQEVLQVSLHEIGLRHEDAGIPMAPPGRGGAGRFEKKMA